MKRVLLILGAVLLSGCHKHHTGIGSTQSVNTVYLGAGQSNMERLNLDALLIPKTAGQASDIAVGNTSLAQWSKGGELYPRLISTIQDAKSHPIVLLWYQGEWEGMNASGCSSWAERFARLVADVRADTGLPNLPVIFFQINPHNMFGPSWDTVREQQTFVHVQGVQMLSSEGCDLDADGLHYSESGYACLADRLALTINGNS